MTSLLHCWADVNHTKQRSTARKLAFQRKKPHQNRSNRLRATINVQLITPLFLRRMLKKTIIKIGSPDRKLRSNKHNKTN